MTTNEERIKILSMLQEGKIDASEAARLLQALDESAKPAAEEARAAKKPRFLHVKVTRVMDGKSIADIRVPISVVNAGMRMGAKFSPHIAGMDPDMLAELLKSDEPSQIIDVTDEEDGEHVQIYLE
ncbi:MAG: DUF2089 domain-containing protein [Chloroflexi bacterium]|jgi:hypothetical protein|nr:DUF2089 domain-containing protein [Chloroflexota bacterium]HOT52959.1 hypothetical protein [Anaerolineaceae bacterium]HQK42925.1 hypothetical protein [Anaerolineaceae bacterium]